MTRSRRAALGVALASLAAPACTLRQAPLAGVIALPARSLSYAPLLLAVRAGLYQTPPARAALLLRPRPPPAARPLLAADPLAGEPRLVAHRTDEALVAAWRDGRVAAFLGHSLATAPATILGDGAVLANFSLGQVAPDATVAHC